jgi:hypothetical protein
MGTLYLHLIKVSWRGFACRLLLVGGHGFHGGVDCREL